MAVHPIQRARTFYNARSINAWVIFYVLIYIILIIKLITIQKFDNGIIFGAYSVLVSLYILSRFALAYLYEPKPHLRSGTSVPTISFGVPSKNEEGNIRETILRIAQSDYPKNKFEVIAINDGSTDRTLQEMLLAKQLAAREGVRVRVTHWHENRGKREGMAECVRQSENDIVIFIDSDSFVEPGTARELVAYFADARVAAVAGHGLVANANTNILTKMQDVRYFVAFKAYKAAEALFGAVTCCSGCCSAYRRKYLLDVLEPWLHQRFLGVQCTYGDDRSLTNFLLQRGYIALFAPAAKAYTLVPDTFRKFMRQQLRWKKSCVRASRLLLLCGVATRLCPCRFIWVFFCRSLLR
jgi:hyaluronan synthase